VGDVSRRIAGFAVAAVIQLVALVLAHELVFLARYGSRFGEMLVHTGHGETWSAAVATSVALGLGLAALATFRLAWLGMAVRRRGLDRERPDGALEPRALLRGWLRVAPRLTLVGVALLSLQENLEHASIGAAVPGPGILLTPEYAGGLWITIAVGLAVSFVAALVEWRRRVLLARLRATRPRGFRAAAAAAPRPRLVLPLPVSSLLGRRSALRAPPVSAAP
jgi:hypothetical protein